MNSEAIILDTARHTLQVEANTLNGVLKVIGGDFVRCVQSIFTCQGRLVVTGVGKSALVGQKIVATLNSTGTPALFMHAADAIHGDLGMVSKEDYMLCISKSGETAEIKVLVPLLKHLGNPIIGMFCQPSSYLARQADFLLYVPVPKEADPNNLAPTASTTAQMAMGDALATALLALRGFSPQDFAQFHPGGTLGKQLYLRVSDLFGQHDPPQVLPSANIQEAIIEMTTKRLGATAIVKENQHLLGIVTDGDLRRMLRQGLWHEDLLVTDIMTKNPVTIAPDTLAVEALNVMRERSITQLVVVDGQSRYLGMIHLHDVLREGIV